MKPERMKQMDICFGGTYIQTVKREKLAHRSGRESSAGHVNSNVTSSATSNNEAFRDVPPVSSAVISPFIDGYDQWLRLWSLPYPPPRPILSSKQNRRM